MQSSDEQLRSRLLQAYEADPDRSKMGRLRKQYDTIIDLQKGGMSLEKILIVLNEDKKPDDCLTMKTFNGYLYLLRKERKSQMSLEVGSVTQEPSTPLKKSGKKKQLSTPAAPGLLGDDILPISKNEKNEMKGAKSVTSNGKTTSTTGTDRVSQEELKATMRAIIDPNEFL